MVQRVCVYVCTISLFFNTVHQKGHKVYVMKSTYTVYTVNVYPMTYLYDADDVHCIHRKGHTHNKGVGSATYFKKYVNKI